MTVTLTQNDVSRAVSVATFHTLRCVLLGATPKNNQDVKRRLDDTLAGYLSEVATAKLLGLPWPQKHTLSWDGRDNGDLIMPNGQLIEVRGSPNPNARYLLGQLDDHPDRMYVMVTATPEQFRFKVHGWIWGADMMDESFWYDRKGGRPCYWVPFSKLQHIATLKVVAPVSTPATTGAA